MITVLTILDTTNSWRTLKFCSFCSADVHTREPNGVRGDPPQRGKNSFWRAVEFIRPDWRLRVQSIGQTGISVLLAQSISRSSSPAPRPARNRISVALKPPVIAVGRSNLAGEPLAARGVSGHA